MFRLSMLIFIFLLNPSIRAEEAKPPIQVWQGSAELGSIQTTGNTDTSSVNAKLELKRKGRIWDHSLQLTALTSKEDNVTSKERYKGTLGIDRNFTEYHYLATTLTYESDRFSGYDYQTLLSVGYGYRLLNSNQRYLDLEIGPGYRYDKLDDGVSTERETVLRILGKFFWKLRQGVEFSQKLTMNTDSQKTTWLSQTGLKSQINGSLATKISYSRDYTNNVPKDTEKTNTEFAVTLVYSF